MSFYLGTEPVPQAILRKESTTLTAGQSVISTGGYSDGDLIQVSLNGVILEGSGVDYTATNGSDITLTVAGSAGDVLQFQTFDAFELVGSKFSAPTITNDVTLKNNTEEDTDGGRSSKLVYKGEQSGGQESTLAEIQASHDGSANDQKGDLIFRTNDGSDGSAPTYAAKIDSDQNLLVGTTDTTLYNNTTGGGVMLSNSGCGFAKETSGSGDPVAYFNNTGDDGQILDLRKDGSTVGSIGANSGVLTVGNANTGGVIFGYNAGHTFIEPSNTSGVSTDDLATLGSGTRRFRDLFLSGGVYLGGTTSANKLEDYEEGTWSGTPTTSNVSGTPTVSKQTYTKIGRKVFIQLKMEASIIAANTRTFFSFTMPFSTDGADGVFSGGGQSEAVFSPFSNQALGGADSSQGSSNVMYWAFLPIQTGSHRMYLHGVFETAT